MSEQDAAPEPNTLEDPNVPAQDSIVPDPTGARQDPATADAIDDATQAAKDEIAAAIANPNPVPSEDSEEAARER